MRTFLKTFVLLVGSIILTTSCGKLAGGGSITGVWAFADYEIICNGVSQPKTERTDESMFVYKSNVIQFYDDGKTVKVDGWGVSSYTIKDNTIYFSETHMKEISIKIEGKRLKTQGWLFMSYPEPGGEQAEVKFIYEKVS